MKLQAVQALAAVVRAEFPIHSLSPAFLREIFQKSTVRGPPKATPLESGIARVESWFGSKWSNAREVIHDAQDVVKDAQGAIKDVYEDAVETLAKKVAVVTKPSGRNSKQTASTDVFPATAANLPEDPAEVRFKQRFAGWESSMPSWTGILSKLRCEKVQSFNSCAEHCFTLNPHFEESDQVNDISGDLIPPPENSPWWKSSGGKSKQDSRPVHGLTLSDLRDFKTCLSNVCVADYIVNDQTPGCMSATGEIAVLRGDHKSTETSFEDLDFYEPQRAERYKKYGVFTIGRFLQMIMPHCDLSTPEGCSGGPGHIFNSTMFLALIGAPLTIALIISRWSRAFLSINDGRRQMFGSFKQSVKASLINILRRMNQWLAKQEKSISLLWANLSRHSEIPSKDEYELMFQRPRDSIVVS